jgi:predicted Zn-dependent protease with MMP-like domain
VVSPAPDKLYKTVMGDPAPDSLAWRGMKAPSLADLEVLADTAYRRLPERFRALCVGLVIHVEDFPTDEVLNELRAETEFDLLGLFQGIGLPFRSESASGQMPNMIWLYRRPILDYWAEHDETLGDIITHVLVHEIGHHFGLSDRDMAAIEQSVR